MDSDAGVGGSLGSDVESGGNLAGTPQTERDRISVAFIEDHCLLREGLTALLGRFSDFEVVATGSDDYAAVFADIEPDVALLDLGLGNGDTLEIVRTLRSGHPGLRIVIMDLLPAQEDLIDYLAIGVCGFVLKDASLAQLVLTIRTVAAGLEVLPGAMVDSLYSEIASAATGPYDTEDSDPTRLTPREQEVADLIAEGLSNKGISQRLQISIHTVKSHLRHVMEKLTLHSRLEVAKYVHEQQPSKEVGHGPRV